MPSASSSSGSSSGTTATTSIRRTTTENSGTLTTLTTTTPRTTSATSTSSSTSPALPSTSTETITTHAPPSPPTIETITSKHTDTTVSTQVASITDATVVTTVIFVTASGGGQPSTIFETRTMVYRHSSTSTVVSTSSGTEAMGAGATGAHSRGKGDKVGGIIGSVVGVTVGFALFLMAIVLFRRRRRMNRISASFDGDFDPSRVEKSQSQRLGQPKSPKDQSVAFALRRDKEDLPTLPDIPLPVEAAEMTQSRYSSTAPYTPYLPPGSASSHHGGNSHHATPDFYNLYSPSYSKPSSPTPAIIHTRDDWVHPSPGPSLSGHGHGESSSHYHSGTSVGCSSSEHGSSKPLVTSANVSHANANIASDTGVNTRNLATQQSASHYSMLERGHRQHNEDSTLRRSTTISDGVPSFPAPIAVPHGFGFGTEERSELESGNIAGSRWSFGTRGNRNGSFESSGSICDDRLGSGNKRARRLSVTNPDPDVVDEDVARSGGNGGSFSGPSADGDVGDEERAGEQQKSVSRPQSALAPDERVNKVVYAGGYDEDARKAYIDSGPVLRPLVGKGRD